MIDYILHLEERFDRARVHEFRRKFMSACDGHATERIMEDAFGKEALDAHRRETPLPDEMYHLIPCADDYVEVEEDDDDPDVNREPETETKEATE